MLAGVADAAPGQIDTNVASVRPGGMCWMRARPAPRCRTFLVTEVGVETPLYSTAARAGSFGGANELLIPHFETRILFTVGGMVNRGQNSAIGGTVSVDNRDPNGVVPSRLELRYRRWREKAGVDVSGGVTQYARHGQRSGQGLTAAAGLELGYVGIDARVDVLKSGDRAMVGGFVGGKATSLAAPLVVAGAVAFIIIMFAQADDSG
jgi:hypothetical protein